MTDATESRPLHVQVAEALGWTWETQCSLYYGEPDKCYGTGLFADGARGCVPRYDTSWSATGPLVERHGITVGLSAYNGKWEATTEPLGEPEGRSYPSTDFHDTPLLAICHLILRLKAEGRL